MIDPRFEYIRHQILLDYKPEKPNIIPKGQKPMTEQEHLECEMEELRLEIKDNAERIDNLCNLLKQNNTKLRTLKQMNTNEAVENKQKEHLVSDLQSKNWYVNMREFIYPQLEVVDENTVKIEGVEYKKVEKEKPQTLYDALCEKDGFIVSKKTTCDIVRGWLIDHTVIETEDAERVTFTILKEQLQTPE